MTANAWFLQRLADILGERVEVARHPETTALGAAFLAGRASGLLWEPGRPAARLGAVARLRAGDERGWREARYGGWRDALAKVRSKL